MESSQLSDKKLVSHYSTKAINNLDFGGSGWHNRLVEKEILHVSWPWNANLRLIDHLLLSIKRDKFPSDFHPKKKKTRIIGWN